LDNLLVPVSVKELNDEMYTLRYGNQYMNITREAYENNMINTNCWNMLKTRHEYYTQKFTEEPQPEVKKRKHPKTRHTTELSSLLACAYAELLRKGAVHV